MKKLILLALFGVAFFASAQDLIVYIVPEEVYRNSAIISQQYKQQDISYNEQKQKLFKQINQIQQNEATFSLDHQSQELNELQNSYDALNTQSTQQYDKIKNSFLPYIKQATDEIYKQNNYKYILNSQAIVLAESGNDISKQVAQLADKLYRDNQK